MTQILSPNRHVGRVKSIRLVVIHTMEVDEVGSAAEAVGRSFANPARKASAHVGIDPDSECRYVPDSDTAWAAPGANADGLQAELAGRAGQTSGDWTDAGSKAILERAAQRTATWCRAHNIPAVHLSDAELAAGHRGIVGHDAVSRVYHRSSHWDPGPAFPWATFIARVREILGAPNHAPTPKPTPKHDDEEDDDMRDRLDAISLRSLARKVGDGTFAEWGTEITCGRKTYAQFEAFVKGSPEAHSASTQAKVKALGR